MKEDVKYTELFVVHVNSDEVPVVVEDEVLGRAIY